MARTAAQNYTGLFFDSSDKLWLDWWVSGSAKARIQTAQVFRDPSAWYHIVCTIDSTNATAANRVRLYVNGTIVSAFTLQTLPTLNDQTIINQSGIATWISSDPVYPASSYYDGYLAEVNFIDGQALTPSSFGSTNALTGVWQPAAYTGSYGTNGFILDFEDNSSLTTSSNVGLGKDTSGNGNYWTTNNISITAGVTYDSMTDVPTLTSATAANFAVGNPLAAQLASGWNIATMQAGNLNWGSAADNQNKVGMATMSMTSGKYYWEVTIGSNFPATSTFLGITKENQQSVSKSTGVYYRNDGQKVIDATSSAYGASYTSGDVIGLAYDATAGTLVCYKNNSSQGTLYSSGTGFSWIPTMSCDNAGSGVTYFNNINFGQRPFAYTPPSGYVSLNTFNLPTSTIVKGNTVMDANLWTGDGTAKTIVNSAAFKPDFVWIKQRSGTASHVLTDSVRGAGYTLQSNGTDAEIYFTTVLTSFNSNGFSVGASGNTGTNGSTYVGWQWQAGQGTNTTNTNGTITSTVSVNASAGFSIVTYTGTGSPGTIGHGLGVTPTFIIVKKRNNTSDWCVYSSAIGNTGAVLLNLTSATDTTSAYWNNTTPTSSVFTVNNANNTNFASATYVAYCWTPIAGYSAFGSYTGNGSTDGPFVYLGFRPRWVMVKATSAVENWPITDSARSPFNAANAFVRADESTAETTGAMIMDFNSNGFKMRTADGKSNGSGVTYIYIAFAENPFKNALAR
jgi:hypothetical protein